MEAGSLWTCVNISESNKRGKYTHTQTPMHTHTHTHTHICIRAPLGNYSVKQSTGSHKLHVPLTDCLDEAVMCVSPLNTHILYVHAHDVSHQARTAMTPQHRTAYCRCVFHRCLLRCSHPRVSLYCMYWQRWTKPLSTWVWLHYREEKCLSTIKLLHI